jgi:NADH-quinone oxidoreductase subunit N
MTSLLANIDPAFKTLAPRAADWLSILPEIAVAGLALLCLLQALLLPPAQRWLQPATARVGLLLVLVMSLTSGTAWNLPHGAENFPASFFTGADGLPAFRGLLRVQLENSESVRLVFLACALGTSLLAGRFLRDRGVSVADYHHVLLIVTAAFMLLARANHFVVFFMALETAAVGLYVLVGNLRRSAASLEAGVKYLVAGGLSSALLLMGIVLIYGSLATPTNDSLGFADIAAALQAAQGNVNPLTLVGVALVFAGAAFKLGAFPFHTWIPDVYQGAPTPTTALLATASKAAGALALFVLVTGPFAALGAKLGPLLAGLAILTLLAGNLAALAATDVKRTLALSGVAHAGFLLAAIAVAVIAPNVHFETIGGLAISAEHAIYFYLYAYILGTFLTSAALVSLPAAEDHDRPLLGLRGLLRRSPVLASALGFGIGSLAGIPPSVGFVAKLIILGLLVKAKLWWVLGVALVGVALSIHYYFSLLREAFIRPTEDGDELAPLAVPAGTRFLVGALCAALLALGVVMLF